MDFAFEKDQELIRKSAKEFFEKECPKDKVRELKNDPLGYAPKMWEKMVNLGYIGLIIPETYGGMEGEYLDMIILMEEMGKQIVPSPYFSTVAECALPILKFGNKEQKKEFLSPIAKKGQIWSLALHEASANYEPSDIKLSATHKNKNYILNGTKMFVPFANVSEKLLVVSRTRKTDDASSGITVFIVDADAPGIHVEEIPTTAKDKKCEVAFKNVSVPETRLLGEPDNGWQILEFLLYNATILKCAEISGSAQAALDITTRYVRERMQFDKPIGSFQAVQHRLVDLLTEVEGLKNLVYEAAWSIQSGIPSKRLISSTKVKANAVHHKVCYNGIVSHGAIGFTEEMDIGLYHLKSRAFEYDLGSTDFHMERIASELENHEPLFLKL